MENGDIDRHQLGYNCQWKMGTLTETNLDITVNGKWGDYTHARMHTHTHTRMHAHVHTHTHAHTQTHVHIHMHAHTHTHTHTHTHVHKMYGSEKMGDLNSQLSAQVACVVI